MPDNNLSARQWSANFTAMTAIILTAAGIYALSLVPLKTLIPTGWIMRYFEAAPSQVGLWGLFVVPAGLFALAVILRWTRFWLPSKAARRKALWIILLALQLAAAGAQYILLSDAVVAARTTG